MTFKKNDIADNKLPSSGALKNLFFKTTLFLSIFPLLFFGFFHINKLDAATVIKPDSHGSFSGLNVPEPPGLSAESNDFIDITAEAAIIVEYETGSILWQKNGTESLFPASTTKMITGILTIEKIPDLSREVEISRNAAGRNNSFFPFNQGDKITLMDLLKSALICSHNNATIALGEYISGSEEEFVRLMNAKAIQIGAFNTNFQNSNGLDSNYPGHKSTAEDLAVIARYCFENDLFRKIVGTKTDTIKLNEEKLVIYNTNILLFFDYVKGIKTGFTDNSGYCLVLYSEREGLKLITVLLKSAEGYRESDALKLINWANDNYFHKKIVDSGQVYKKIEVRNIAENKNYSSSSSVFTYSYPEGDFEKLVKRSAEITLKDSLKETGIEGSGIFTPSLPLELPLAENYEIGDLEVFIDGKEEVLMKLISKDNIDKPDIIIELSEKTDSRIRNALFFLITFYFLIFILIIVRNLTQKKSAD
ncbi:MAG: D-alanyl-D-alanine carboxypeptidase [Actinobacteria bacterium]|nr:D-alanyl-D-alanine carboxypeptidase [Actinomycetota bacterium]